LSDKDNEYPDDPDFEYQDREKGSNVSQMDSDTKESPEKYLIREPNGVETEAKVEDYYGY
jgi:hypothetical protein